MDPLDEAPEFGPAEQIPLVVPDLPPRKRQCVEKNKLGNPCRVPPLKGEDRCLGHAKSLAPELRDKWRSKRVLPATYNRKGLAVGGAYKSKEELLSILSHRLDLIKMRWAEVDDAGVDERICDICRTIGFLLKIETTQEDVKSLGWRMKGSG